MPGASHSGAIDESLWLGGLLARLPTRQRQAVVLRYLEDMPIERVAEIMNCSTGTVKMASHDGLTHLRQMLSAVKEEELTKNGQDGR